MSLLVTTLDPQVPHNAASVTLRIGRTVVTGRIEGSALKLHAVDGQTFVADGDYGWFIAEYELLFLRLLRRLVAKFTVHTVVVGRQQVTVEVTPHRSWLRRYLHCVAIGLCIGMGLIAGVITLDLLLNELPLTIPSWLYDRL